MRTMTAFLWIILAAGPSFAGAAQGRQDDDKKVKFNLRDASVSALVEYLRDQTGWIIVETDAAKKIISRKKPKITATSDAEVPLSRVQDFVDTALKPHGLATMKVKNVLVLATEKEAKDKTHQIRVGTDPNEIEISDRVITQIMPLKNISVATVMKEMKDVLKAAGSVSLNSHANVFLVSGRSQDIHRLAKILTQVDAQVSDQLKVRVLALKNADATVLAKALNETFRRERTGGSSKSRGGGIMGMFGGWGGRGGRGRRGSRGGGSSIEPGSPAGQMIRITPDSRTNSLVIVATPENADMVEKIAKQLDTESGAAMKLKLYSLRNADATEVARVITELYSQESKNQGGGGFFGFGRRGGRRGGGQAEARGRQVKAVAESRTNAVVVTALQSDFKIIDDLIFELDRQVTDVLKVRVYKLKNADAVEMTQILKDIFRKQTQQSQSNQRGRQQNRGGGRGGRMRFGNSRGSQGSSLPPSQEVEITADARTNSIVVKASEEYQAIISSMVRDLDSDPTEKMTTYTIQLKNASAEQVATVLRDLLRGTGGRSSTRRTQNNNRTNNNSSRTRTRDSGSNRRGGGGRRGN